MAKNSATTFDTWWEEHKEHGSLLAEYDLYVDDCKDFNERAKTIKKWAKDYWEFLKDMIENDF